MEKKALTANQQAENQIATTEDMKVRSVYQSKHIAVYVHLILYMVGNWL